MNPKELLLVHRYAQAYYNIFSTELTQKLCVKFSASSAYFKTKSALLFLLDLSLMSSAQKEEKIISWCVEQELPDSCKKLFLLLIKQQRLVLIPAIFDHIVMIFEKKHAIEHVVITSSCALAQQEKICLEKFLQKQLGKQIVLCTYQIDPKFIAGIRMQGSTFLWENSMKNRLDILYNSLTYDNL